MTLIPLFDDLRCRTPILFILTYLSIKVNISHADLNQRILVTIMSDAVRQIKERLSILDVVAPYVELHKAGKNFKGKSPFATEKTPSFYVSPDRGMYYCFSTSQGGDIFSFIQIIEGVDFRQALKILADKANVELVPEAPEKRSERERLYALLDETATFFTEWLPLAPVAVAYLEKRGVKAATITKWRIGYAPGPNSGGWRLLKDHLGLKGYSVAEMMKAGVVKPGTEGKEPFDVFRDRVMFPLRDASGRVVGFSGRTLAPDEKTPKYVNSPETDLYKKSELLFGFDLAKNTIRTLDFSLIVEGQFDVVMAHQAGYTNTVAVSGTALTAHHVQQLERLSTRVVLALDADRAGIAAMKRGAELMLKRGLDVKVAALPDGADPADLVAKDVTLLKQAVGHATPIIEFLLLHLKKSVTDERAFRLRVSSDVLPYVMLIPNRIDQEHFIGVVAEALSVSKESVRFEVERLVEAGAARPTHNTVGTMEAVVKTEPAPLTRVGRTEQKEELVSHLVASVELLTGPAPSLLKEALEEAMLQPFVVVAESVTEQALARSIFTIESAIEKYSYKSFVEDVVSKLNHLRDICIREAIAHQKNALRTLELSGDTETPTTIMAELIELEKRRKVPPYDAEFLTPQKRG